MNTERRPGTSLDEPGASLSLWDWRRQVAEIYTRVRTLPAEEGWEHWRLRRMDLFATHPQTPIPTDRRADRRAAFFPYDPELRVTARVESTDETRPMGLPHSGDGTTHAHPFGRLRFGLGSGEHSLTAFWLDDYGGGVFVPFRDSTNGNETYGGGRYLLDTAKGADLGHDGFRVVLDFNFSYHPSCAHDPRWSCPLAPPSNSLPVPIRGGERLDIT